MTVKRAQTSQTTSKEFSSFQKRSSSFSKVKRLQLKLTKTLQNSYQISSQHQVPKTWVKQHPKTSKPTKTKETPSPGSSMHKLVPFGSKLVPTWFLWIPMGSIVQRSVPTNLIWFQDRFKDVQVGSRWFSTLYILSPNFHTPSWTVVLYTEVPIDYHTVCKATKF